MKVLTKWYPWMALVPLLMLALAWALSANLDGWSGWAAAGLFALPVGASIGCGLLGLVLIVGARRRSEEIGLLCISTLLAASVALGLMARLLLM